MSDRLLETTEAGRRLGRSRKTICEWIRRGVLPAKLAPTRHHRGRPRYLVLESEVERFMREIPDAIPSPDPSEANRRRRARRGNLSDVVEFV